MSIMAGSVPLSGNQHVHQLRVVIMVTGHLDRIGIHGSWLVVHDWQGYACFYSGMRDADVRVETLPGLERTSEARIGWHSISEMKE